MAQGDLPVYDSHAGAPRSTFQEISGVTPPSYDATKVGAAAEHLGAAGIQLAAKLKTAQDHTVFANATTSYLTELDALEQTAKKEVFSTAKTSFEEKWGALIQSKLGAIDDPSLRARAAVEFARAGIVAQHRVNTDVLSRESNANVATDNAQELIDLRDASAAGSPAERGTAISRRFGAIDALASSGWIDATEAEKRKQRFNYQLDASRAMDLTHNDPVAAVKALSDPNNFPALNPVQLQTFRDNAEARVDRMVDANVVFESRLNPGKAVAELGRVAGQRGIAEIFKRGVMPTENAAGDNKLVSDKGAVGVTQILPGTARDVAKSLGTPLEGDDKAVTVKLQQDPDLNVRLGTEYFRQMVNRYGGNVPVALAAYNGGPGNADRWLAAAVEKFGPNFSPAQFASVVDFKETRDYVGKVYKNLGADIAVDRGVSQGARIHAAVAIESALRQDESADTAQIKLSAALSRESFDPKTSFEHGLAVDPAAYQGWKATQMQAAQLGDGAARRALRDADIAEAILPVRQAILRMAPADAEAAIAKMDTDLRANPKADDFERMRLEGARETLKQVDATRKHNVVGLAEAAGLVAADQRVTIDPRADPGDQVFRRGLSVRGAVAGAAATHYLGNAIALKPEETAALKARYDQAGPDERFRIVEAFGATLTGAAYRDTMDAVVGNDSIDRAAGVVARTNPAIAREILNGAKLMKGKDVGDKAALVRPALAEKVGGQLFPNPEDQTAIVNAALALYVSRRGRDDTLFGQTDSSGVEKALEDVIGPVVKRNGMAVPITPGIPKAAFLGALDRLQDTDVAAYGGALDKSGKAVTADVIRDYGVLRPTAPGSALYFVGQKDARVPDGFAPFFTDQGRPLVFDMRDFATRIGAPPAVLSLPALATPQQRMRAAVRNQAPLPGDVP